MVVALIHSFRKPKENNWNSAKQINQIFEKRHKFGFAKIAKVCLKPAFEWSALGIGQGFYLREIFRENVPDKLSTKWRLFQLNGAWQVFSIWFIIQFREFQHFPFRMSHASIKLAVKIIPHSAQPFSGTVSAFRVPRFVILVSISLRHVRAYTECQPVVIFAAHNTCFYTFWLEQFCCRSNEWCERACVCLPLAAPHRPHSMH